MKPFFQNSIEETKKESRQEIADAVEQYMQEHSHELTQQALKKGLNQEETKELFMRVEEQAKAILINKFNKKLEKKEREPINFTH